MLSFTVLFQMISPKQHPEHYCPAHGSHPWTRAVDIPEEHWQSVEVTHTNHGDALAHYRGLLSLQFDGEYVRRIHMTSSLAEQDLPEDVGAQ